MEGRCPDCGSRGCAECNRGAGCKPKPAPDPKDPATLARELLGAQGSAARAVWCAAFGVARASGGFLFARARACEAVCALLEREDENGDGMPAAMHAEMLREPDDGCHMCPLYIESVELFYAVADAAGYKGPRNSTDISEWMRARIAERDAARAQVTDRDALRFRLRVLCDVFESFLGDLGHGEDSLQREYVAEARRALDPAAALKPTEADHG